MGWSRIFQSGRLGRGRNIASFHSCQHKKWMGCYNSSRRALRNFLQLSTSSLFNRFLSGAHRAALLAASDTSSTLERPDFLSDSSHHEALAVLADRLFWTAGH